nr:ankyrin repeat domain [Hymenolepis microstoma]
MASRPSRHRPNSESHSQYYTGTTLTETWFDKDTPFKSRMSPPSGHVSPRLQTSPTPSAEHVPGGYSRIVEVARSPGFTTNEETDGVSTLQYQHFRRTPVQRTKSPSLGGSHTYRSDSPNIPLRNYSYKVTVEMRKAVEALSSFYMTSSSGTLTDDLQVHLEVVRKAWFDVVSKTNIDIEQVEDLFAFLYNSAPQLLYLFIRMPTTRVRKQFSYRTLLKRSDSSFLLFWRSVVYHVGKHYGAQRLKCERLTSVVK